MYKRTFWKDHVEGVQEGTDMNAAHFNNIEVGAMEANALAALNSEYQRHANDIAKNNEVVTVEQEFGEYGPSDTFEIVIPANATRNNINYIVVPEIFGISGADPVTISVHAKQANGFTVSLRGSASTVYVRFHISGGMI